MTVGKNKRVVKGKKGIKKKVIDPFARKDWYDVKAPSLFNIRNVGKTLVNRSQGMKNADDSLKGRVFDVSLADLMQDESKAFRKIALRVDEVSGKECLTNFREMDMTSDKLKSLVRKWQSLIEAHADIKTADGYLLRIFVIAFTRRTENQVRKNCYAQSSQIRVIRQRMVEVVGRETNGLDLKDLVSKMIAETIGAEIEKACWRIFPLHNVFVRKVKILKEPKYDQQKLMELHTGTNIDDTGSKIQYTEFKEPPVLDWV